MLEKLFPNLNPSNHQKTSPETSIYNCIAWAMGIDDAWWEPLSNAGYYWPEKKIGDYSIRTLKKIFERSGYEECSNSDYESGYEKIAIYGNENEYTHAARQLKNGKWTSKIGALQDIEHDSLEALIGNEYGVVKHIMKREIDEKK